MPDDARVRADEGDAAVPFFEFARDASSAVSAPFEFQSPAPVVDSSATGVTSSSEQTVLDADMYVDLRRSLWASGLLHIVYEIGGGLLVTVLFASGVVDQLKEVCRLLK